MRIDSYKCEKRKLQRITISIAIRLTPCVEDVQTVELFIKNELENARTMQGLTQRMGQERVLELPDLKNTTPLERVAMVCRSPSLLSDCMFIKYRQLKVYTFSLPN
jgi:hypothetical protein